MTRLTAWAGAWLLALATATWATAGVGQPAPDFTLKDQDGQEVSLAGLRGKIVVLEWTNPDCPFVQRHYRAKTMTTLAERYRDRDVVWLAVNSTHSMDAERNRTWREQQAFSYAVLDDHAGTVGNAYGAKTTPNVFIVDRDGTLAYQGAIDDDAAGEKGAGARNYVAEALEDLTAKKPVRVAETKPYGCSVKYAR